MTMSNRMVVLSVFDVQAQAFMLPMFVRSQGVGVRMIQDEVNRAAQDNNLYLHAKDFRVFELGVFDDGTGVFDLHPQPTLVCDCVALQSKG